MSKFKLGPVQEQWLEALEAHPERQYMGLLGASSDGGNTYKACCLGELLITYKRKRKKKIPWADDGRLCDYDDFNSRDSASLEYSYEKLGLNNPDGIFIDPETGEGYIVKDDSSSAGLTCLASLNDYGWTWPEIAAWVRKNPELVFTKSV